MTVAGKKGTDKPKWKQKFNQYDLPPEASKVGTHIAQPVTIIMVRVRVSVEMQSVGPRF